LEIVTAEPAGDINNLANKKQPPHGLCLHRGGIQGSGVNSTESNLRCAVALRACRREGPGIHSMGKRAQGFVAGIGQIARKRVQELYDWSVLIPRLIAVYKSIGLGH
jgi:hypothetical protein